MIQSNFNQNTNRFIHEIAPENIVCEMAAMWSRGGHFVQGRWDNQDFAIYRLEDDPAQDPYTPGTNNTTGSMSIQYISYPFDIRENQLSAWKYVIM